MTFALTVTEREELTQHEAVIERGLKSFVGVGLALAAIRDRKLYRQEFGTFKAYCQSRWGFERAHAYRLIDAAHVTENVSNWRQIEPPKNEAQARPLTVLEPEQQAEVWARVVDTAPEAGLTAAHVKRVVTEFVRHEKGQDEALPFPAGKFQVVYADPPWSYDNSGFSQSAASHYPTMATSEICALPVAGLCMPDSVLFLWATSPLLDQAFKVIEAWGFTYKASMVWNKGKAPGIGWFVQTEHELLLIATRDGNRHPETKPKSVISESPIKHSAKPETFYRIIESMYPGPYCELFARETRSGWSSWGHEI